MLIKTIICDNKSNKLDTTWLNFQDSNISFSQIIMEYNDLIIIIYSNINKLKNNKSNSNVIKKDLDFKKFYKYVNRFC